MKEEWLFPNAFVPVDVETTSALIVEIKRLIDVVGSMALAQPAQEPVGVFCEDDDIGYVRLIPHQQMKLKAWDKLYTTPQQRPWVGLTDEEIDYLYVEHRGDGGPTAICEQFAKAYEAYLKEKNNG
jgi:hypothetical protein